jgi:hypothetical protein
MGGAHGTHAGQGAAAPWAAHPPGGAAGAAPPAPPPAPARVAVPLLPIASPDDTPLSGPRPTRGVAVSREVREL